MSLLEYDETPQLVAVNQRLLSWRKISDEKSSKFINGILSQFVTEE